MLGRMGEAVSTKPLTVMQAAFVRELESDPLRNATQAAIRAGAAPGSAKVVASKWLRLANVQSALANVTTKALERAQVALATEEAIASAAWIVEQAVKVVEIGMATVPVKGRDGKVISRIEKDADGNETEVPEFYEAHNLAAVNGALKLLSQRFPSEFAPEAGSGERGDQHVHFHGLTETELRKIASGLRS